MPINLLDPSLGIQNILEQRLPDQSGMLTARPIAASILREAGLEELYSPVNAQRLVEETLCPDVGDGDLLLPDIFGTNLRKCTENLSESKDPAVRDLVEKELKPLLENKTLLNAYTGLMIGG